MPAFRCSVADGRRGCEIGDRCDPVHRRTCRRARGPDGFGRATGSLGGILGPVTESNRRDFLRALGRRAARDARDVAQVAAPVLRATSPLGTAAALRSLGGPSDELADQVRDEGLDARLDDVRALARPAVRMTPALDDVATATAWLDLVGAEELLDPAAPTMLLAQVSLASEAFARTWLPRDGWLVVFVDGAAATSVIRLDEAAMLAPTAAPMTLSAEIALPDVHSAQVRALGLSDEERAAYFSLRHTLADDVGDHLFGFADGFDEDLGEGDWELLVQVRICPTKYVYVWVPDRDLDRAVAFIG